MIVTDASAAIAALLNDGPPRRMLGADQLHVPHLIDSEVASVLRRHVQAGRITADDGWRSLDAWRRLAVVRYPTYGLLPRIWHLSDNLSAYDAGYVALAEALDCPLVTADARLAHAAGLTCTITVVPG